MTCLRAEGLTADAALAPCHTGRGWPSLPLRPHFRPRQGLDCSLVQPTRHQGKELRAGSSDLARSWAVSISLACLPKVVHPTCLAWGSPSSWARPPLGQGVAKQEVRGEEHSLSTPGGAHRHRSKVDRETEARRLEASQGQPADILPPRVSTFPPALRLPGPPALVATHHWAGRGWAWGGEAGGPPAHELGRRRGEVVGCVVSGQ